MFMENNLVANKEQEINLWEILQQIARWCIKSARVLFIFLLKKSVQLAVCAFAGVAVGGVLYVTGKPYYSTHMLVRANTADNFYYVTLINAHVAPENIENSRDLAKNLGVPEHIAKQVNSIRACYAIDLNKDGLPDAMDEKNKYIFSKDSAKAAKILHGSFYINVQIYSSEALPYIRQSIMNIISKNDYIQHQNTRRLEEVKEQIAYLYQQRHRFDSLQQYEYFQKERNKRTVGSGQLLILNEQNQPLYHNDLISLNDRILANNTVLQLYSEPVTIIHDFTETTRRKNSLMFYAKPFVIAFLLLGFVSLLIWDYRKTLVKLYRATRQGNE
jgi:hypothetical protein